MGVFDTTLLKTNVKGLRYAIIGVAGAFLLLVTLTYLVKLFHNSHHIGEGIHKASACCLTMFVAVCTFMSVLVSAFGMSQNYLIATFVFMVLTLSCLARASFCHFSDDSRAAAQSLYNAFGTTLVMTMLMMLAPNGVGGVDGNTVQSTLSVPILVATLAAAVCATSDAI